MSETLRCIVSAGLLSALSVSFVAAQTPDQEIATLRQFLKLPDSVSVTVASAPRLSAANPIKLFVATGLDLGVRQNFLKWADEWNQKDAKKHGRIVLVADSSSADVVLARVTDRDKAHTATDTNLATGVVYDPGTHGVRSAPYARQYSYTEVPVFAYVLAHTEPGSLEVVWRYTGPTSGQEGKESGKQLWDDFKTLMKSRSVTSR